LTVRRSPRFGSSANNSRRWIFGYSCSVCRGLPSRTLVEWFDRWFHICDFAFCFRRRFCFALVKMRPCVSGIGACRLPATNETRRESIIVPAARQPGGRTLVCGCCRRRELRRRFKGGYQSFHDISDELLPFHVPYFSNLESDIILVSRLLVRQVAQFHRFKSPYNHG